MQQKVILICMKIFSIYEVKWHVPRNVKLSLILGSVRRGSNEDTNLTSSSQLTFLHLKLMDLGLKVISFLSGAARSNLYGLACPFYCTQPSVSLVLLAFLVGAILGAILTTLVFWNLTFSPASAPSRVATRHSALAGYLHARISPEQRRGN